MKPLKNARHEKFVISLLKGMTQTDAAIDAGYKRSRAYETSSELVRNSKIIARRQDLEARTETDTVLTVKERKESLSEQASQPLVNKSATGKERVMAIAELNKMAGDYALEKHAILGDILIEVMYREK